MQKIRAEVQKKTPPHARTEGELARVMLVLGLNPAAKPAVMNDESPSRATIASSSMPR
jgi:hypothetical protein